MIDRTRTVWRDILSTVKPESATFDNVIEPIIQDENEKSTSMRLLRFYASTSTSKGLRDASNAAVTVFANAEVDLFSKAEMFALVDAVMARHPFGEGLQDEAYNYLEKLYSKFWQNGCGISNKIVKAHFERCQKRLKDLERECNKNLHEETTGLWLTREELDGVPSSFMSQFKQGEGEREGHFWVATKVPQSSPIMNHAEREATRRKMFYAIQNRMPENVPLFRELVLLRDETARLLGYPNHAALKTASKLVKNPETVTSILSEIMTRLVPRGAEYARELQELKNNEAAARGKHSTDIFLWDQSYYARQQSEKETAHAGGAELSEYFELHHTLAKLLQMFEHLFATRFEIITPEQRLDLGSNKPLIWQEDVLLFAVYDSDKLGFLGYAYFDLFSREGKYTHCGHYSLQANLQQQDGTHFHASSALVMNYNKAANRPTLLSLEEVRKLFHEIGHLIHALCTETTYAASQYVDRDFVEAPSLMFEQFFWKEQHIKDVSFHYSHISPRYRDIWEASIPEKLRKPTDQVQPAVQLHDDVVSALSNSSTGWKIVRDQLRDLFFSTFDMLIHTPTSHETLETMNLAESFNKMKSEVYSLPGGERVDGWEWGHGESVFRNVINNYDAGYYSYVLVFALDIFETGFEKDTMNKEAGRRYRNMVLRVGGSQPEIKTLTDYLGREPSTGPYFRYLGIATGNV